MLGGMKRTWVFILSFLAFCGLADSAYLAQHEISGTPLVCTIKGLTDCNVVATSAYSHIFGVPTAVLGVAFYALLFIVAALELVVSHRPLRRMIQALALTGLVASLYFVGVQIFAIHAYCVYCLTSALIELIIFIIAFFIEPMPRRQEKIELPASRGFIPPSPHLPMPPRV